MKFYSEERPAITAAEIGLRLADLPVVNTEPPTGAKLVVAYPGNVIVVNGCVGALAVLNGNYLVSTDGIYHHETQANFSIRRFRVLDHYIHHDPAPPIPVYVTKYDLCAVAGYFNAAITETKIFEGTTLNGDWQIRLEFYLQALGVLSPSPANDELAAISSVNNSYDTAVSFAEIGNDQIADGAVTEDKISDGAVNEDKISDGAVTPSKISEGYSGTINIPNYYEGDSATMTFSNGILTNFSEP